MKKVMLLLFSILSVIGCDSNINEFENVNSNNNQPTMIPFRNLLLGYSFYQFSVINDEFYVIRDSTELNSTKNVFNNYTGDHFYNLFQNFNFSDSTIIGYTTANRKANFFRADSIVKFNDTIKIFYTYNFNTAYNDAPNISSIVAIEQTNLPIILGEINFEY